MRTESIETILEKIAPFLLSELRGLGCVPYGADGEDLLQEIRLRLWQALEKKGGEIEFLNSYAKKIVLSVFINEVERIHKERRLIEAAGTEAGRPGQGPGPGGRRGPGDQTKEIVMASLAELAGAKRRVVELRLEGFTLAEIAGLYGWPIGRARSTYYRGLKDMKRQLAKRGVEHGN